MFPNQVVTNSNKQKISPFSIFIGWRCITDQYTTHFAQKHYIHYQQCDNGLPRSNEASKSQSASSDHHLSHNRLNTDDHFLLLPCNFLYCVYWESVGKLMVEGFSIPYHCDTRLILQYFQLLPFNSILESCTWHLKSDYHHSQKTVDGLYLELASY